VASRSLAAFTSSQSQSSQSSVHSASDSISGGIDLTIAEIQSLPLSTPVCVLDLADTCKPQEVLAVDARACHRERSVRQKADNSDLLGDVAELEDQVNFSVTVIAADVAVAVSTPEVGRQLPAVVDAEDSRPLVCESCELEDVVAALCCFESFIVHRTKFTSRVT